MATIATTTPPTQPGDSPAHIGPFELISRLCESRDTVFWAATQRRTRGFLRTVAIKCAKAGAGAATSEWKRSSLFREASIGGVLDHPSLCRTLDVGISDGRPYLVCELIRGWNLRSVLATAELSRTPVPLAAALTILHSASEGAHYMHELLGRGGRWLGLVHRAIDDSNLMLARPGYVKLVDFGLTAMTAFETRARLTGRALTPFAAPELSSQGGFDRRADVYSLGVLLSALVKQLPFQCSGDLRAIVSCATASRPRDRFASARDLQRALEGVALARGIALSNAAVAIFLEKIFAAPEKLTAAPETLVAAPEKPARATLPGLEEARREPNQGHLQGRTRVRLTRKGRSQVARQPFAVPRPRRHSTGC